MVPSFYNPIASNGLFAEAQKTASVTIGCSLEVNSVVQLLQIEVFEKCIYTHNFDEGYKSKLVVKSRA